MAQSVNSVRLLKGMLKPEQFSADEQLLERFRVDHSLVDGTRPAIVVYPETREEVQAIVNVARENRTPVVPVSSGAPHFKGDTVPSSGGIIVDFTRMRQIIKLDEYNRIARIQPGVTFSELMPQLAAMGQRLNAPLAPRANKSVVASALEREVPIMPKYSFDFMDPLTTLEVVYGTGDDFRTGSAAGPGKVDADLTADLVNPWGPGVFDYYRFISAAQGTMGLVTWAVIRTEVKPTVRKLLFVALPDVGSALAPVNQILRRRVADECLLLDNVTMATLVADKSSDMPRLEALFAPFTLIVGIGGYRRRAEERVAIYERHFIDICAECGLMPQQTLPGAAGLECALEEVISNSWTREPYWKLRRGDGMHEILFLCPLNMFPVYVNQMRKLVSSSTIPNLNYGVYVQPAVQGRAAQVSFFLPFDSADRASVSDLYLSASRALMENGAFFSRPYGPWADMVYRVDKSGAALLRRLKVVFDPSGILNPGKLCFDRA